MEKITVYSTSEFFGSVVKHEGYLKGHGLRKYAQYDAAPYVDFKPRGKRKFIRLQKSYKPYLLILAGWDNPDSKGLFNEGVEKGGVTIKKSTYSSFDDGFRVDFDKIIDGYKDKFIADYRCKIEEA